MIDVFPTPVFVLLQIFPFAGVLIVLKYVLLDPLLQYLLERDERSIGAMGVVRDLNAQTAEAQREYDTRVNALRADLADIRGRLVAEANAQEALILAGARSEADSRIASFRESVAAEVERCRTDLQTTNSELAVEIASTVLGRPVAAGQAGNGEAR